MFCGIQYSGLTKTGTALSRLSSKRTIPLRCEAPIESKLKPVRRCLALPYYLYCFGCRLVLIFVNPLYPLPKLVRTQKAYSFKRHCSTCCREAEPDTETRRGDMPLEKWRQFLDWVGKTPSETASRSRKARPNKKCRLKFFRRHRVSFKH
ncbi:putative phage associated protein [Neisseria meningitidis]|nr:putative phage associated protein [Neisseria meningitidis]